MMRTIMILLFISNVSIGQTIDRIKRNFDLEFNYLPENLKNKYKSFSYDFSNLWLTTDVQDIYGIIGDEHQRIAIKLISITRISDNPFLYSVYGKSKVKGNICEFYGTIHIKTIREVKTFHFGVDDKYMGKGIKAQGVLIADYEFNEDKNQKYSGVFKGKLYTKWYLNSRNQIVYDDIEFTSDGYLNNAFHGVWTSNVSRKEKICNWADYRVPVANRDFDIGAGEFRVSKKYADRGWLYFTEDRISNLIKETKWWE